MSHEWDRAKVESEFYGFKIAQFITTSSLALSLETRDGRGSRLGSLSFLPRLQRALIALDFGLSAD